MLVVLLCPVAQLPCPQRNQALLEKHGTKKEREEDDRVSAAHGSEIHFYWNLE
jgi:hypothetical protein